MNVGGDSEYLASMDEEYSYVCYREYSAMIMSQPEPDLFPLTLVVMVSWLMMTATGLEYLDSFLVLDSSTTSS